jgi:hypothetical protein
MMSKRRKPAARHAGHRTAGSLTLNAFSPLDVLIAAPFARAGASEGEEILRGTALRPR